MCDCTGNLNALFVYEARATLLLRIAQTRQGAERLLEHRLFSALSDCKFISAKPEIDQRGKKCSLATLYSTHRCIDGSTFLPDAIQRYHQILLPTLQLGDSVLGSAGSLSKHHNKQVRFMTCFSHFLPNLCRPSILLWRIVKHLCFY